jgi:pyridoxamine 5'-phosphate oxidase-like protein
MTDREPTEVTNLDIYGHPPLPWSRAAEALEIYAPTPDVTFFLGTVTPDGHPHAAGVGVAWHNGDLYFTSGPRARKARNLAAHPECTISMRLPGVDLVLEGSAERVTDPQALEEAAALYRAGGWPTQVEGDAFTAPYSAPSAGPPPWNCYRFRFHTAFGVATAEPHGATRWRF